MLRTPNPSTLEAEARFLSLKKGGGHTVVYTFEPSTKEAEESRTAKDVTQRTPPPPHPHPPSRKKKKKQKQMKRIPGLACANWISLCYTITPHPAADALVPSQCLVTPALLPTPGNIGQCHYAG